MYLKIPFIIFAILLSVLLLFYKLYLSKKPRTEKTGQFISFIGGLILLYMLSGVLMTIFSNGIINRLIIAICTFSPILIGKFATYEKENFYSYLQIVFITFSFVYVLIV